MGKFEDLTDISILEMFEENKEPIAVGLITILALLSLSYFFSTFSAEEGFGEGADFSSCPEICKEKGYKGAKSSKCTSIVECNSPNVPLSNGDNPCSGIDTCCCTQSTCDQVCKSEGYSGAAENTCTPIYECKSPNSPVETEECEGVEGCCCEN